MTDRMTPDPNEPSVVASQAEEAMRLYFEVAYQSMVLNGLSPDYKLLIVGKHANGKDFIVGTLDYQEGVDITQKYIAKRVASQDAAKAAIDRVKKKGNKRG